MTNPGGMQYPGVRSRRPTRSPIAAGSSPSSRPSSRCNDAVAIGRASVARETVQPAAAPAPVTVTAPASTVTRTVTSTPAPVTVTADPVTVTVDPATVTAPPVSVTTTVSEAAAEPAATLRNGINLVGTDVQPGSYRSDMADCYWARLSGTSGDSATSSPTASAPPSSRSVRPTSRSSPDPAHPGPRWADR